MSETTGSLRSLLEKSQDYLENRIEVTKLRTIDKSSELLSTIAVVIILILPAVLFLLFVSAALAIYLGHHLGRMYYGFLIVGGVYGVTGLLVYIRRNEWIKTPVSNGIIKKLIN
jgi:hypothetical protein